MGTSLGANEWNHKHDNHGTILEFAIKIYRGDHFEGIYEENKSISPFKLKTVWKCESCCKNDT